MAERDEVAQMIYDDLNKQGIFKNDEVAQMIGHDLRGSGLVMDPTQGGLVNPTPPPSAAPTPAPYTRQPGAPPVPPPIAAPLQASTPSPMAAQPTAPTAVAAPPVRRPGKAPRPNLVQAALANPLFTDVTPDAATEAQYATQPTATAKPIHISGIQPLSFKGAPQEDILRAKNAALDKLPAFTHRPGFVPAEEGPIGNLKREQVQATVELGHQLPHLWQEWAGAASQYKAEDDLLMHAVKQIKKQGGFVSEADRNAFNRVVALHQQNGATLNQRLDHLKSYQNSANAVATKYQSTPFHSGLLYPQEEAQQGTSTGQNFVKNLLNLKIAGIPVNPLTSPEEGEQQYREAKAKLQLSGQWPTLPPLSKKPNEASEQIRQKNDLVKKLSAHYPGGSNGYDLIQPVGPVDALNTPTSERINLNNPAGRQLMASLTPWQRQILPSVTQGLLMERKASIPAYQSLIGSMGAADVAEVFGRAAGGSPRLAALERMVMSKAGTPIEERLLQWGLNPLKAKIIATALPKMASGAIGGMTGGGVASGLNAFFQTGSLKQAGKATLAALGPMGILGAATGLGEHGQATHAALGEGLPVPIPGEVTPAHGLSERKPHGGTAVKPDIVNLPGGAKIDLNTATRAELETASNNLPAIHPAARKIREKLWGHNSDVAIPAGTEPGGELAAKEPPPPSTATIHTDAGSVPARSLSADDINNVLQDYATQETQAPLTPEQAQGKAQAVKQAELHQQYNEDRSVPIRPESGQAYQDAWTSAKSGGKTHYDLLNNAADQVRDANPELAGKLDQAKETLRQDFQRDFRQGDLVQNGVLEKPSSYPAPPEQSVWRGLSEDERKVLPEPVKKVLLTQDLTNSLQVLSPDTPTRDLMKGVDTRSSKALEKIADQRAGEAEQAFGAKHGVTSAVTSAVTSPVAEPEVPAASETAPASNAHQIEPTPEAVTPQAQAGEAVPPANQINTGGAQHDLDFKGAMSFGEGGLTGAFAEDLYRRFADGKGPVVRAPMEDAAWERQQRQPFRSADDLRQFLQDFMDNRSKPAGARPGALPGEAAPTSPAEVPVERRVNTAQRKAVAEMSPEEMKTALHTDDLSGLKNKRAWEEEPRKSHVAYIDADGLGAINKAYGESAGDALIREMGNSLRAAGLGDDAYRRGGDEFRAQHDNPDELRRRIDMAREVLEKTTFSFTDLDGKERTLKGASLSYGTGPDEKIAEAAEQADKQSRRDAGIRAQTKEELPPRLAEVGRGGGEVSKGNAGEVTAAVARGDRGHQEEARPVEKGASKGTDANGRPVIQPKGTPGKDMSDFQAFGTNFPAEWDMQEQQAKPRLADDVLQRRQALQRQQENEARRQQGLPPKEQPLQQMAQQQHGSAMDAAELQKRQAEQRRQQAQAQGITEASPPEGVSPDVIAKLFPDPETRNLFLHDKGDPTRVVGFREEARQKWQGLIAAKDQLVNGWKRVFPDLERTAAHSELEQLLLRRMDADAIANFKTQNSIRQALHGLSKTEQFAFNALAYNKDMIREIARQRERFLKEGGDEADFKPLLRDGWTEAKVLATQKAIADTLANDKSIDAKKVTDAYQKVIDYRKPIVDKFVKLYEKVNGRKLEIDPEDYFRHNMLLAEAGGYGKGSVAGVHGRPGRSHLKGRIGSDIAYNSDFVEAELSWMPDMIKDTMDLQILSHVQDNYDIAKVVKAAKAEINDPGLLDYLQEHASGLKPTKDMLPAMGKLAAAGSLPDRMDGRFSTLIHSLHHMFETNMELKRLGKPEIGLSPEMEKELPAYAKWLVKQKGENVSARSIADDPNWLKRNGYSEFQAIEGRHFFKVMSVPERLMKDAQGQLLQSLDINPNDLRTVMALGQERRTMVVPEEIAKTLDRFAARPEDNYHSWLAKGMRTVQQWWKLDKLYNPVHSSIYWIGNALSDADAIMRGNPKALRYVTGAGKELFNVLVRGKDPGETLKTWIERGGIASSFVAREAVGRGNGVDMLRDYAARQRPFYQVLLGGVQQAFTMPHELREATGRYATYLAYLDDMKKTGQPRNYGASNPALVDGLSDIHDKAWKLSNDLIGPYNEVNATGQFLRRNVFPFWSWQAVSAGREKMLLKNAWDAPAIAERMGKKLSGGAAVGVRAMALGRYAAGAASVGLTIEAWNRLQFGPNYRDKLPKDMRDRVVPVLCLRYDPQSDTMLYMDRPGNLVDVANWLNLNKGYGYYQDYMNRKMTLPEIAQDMFATGAKNRLWQQAGFHLKFGTDVVLGFKTFPDVNNPRPARDKAQQFFDTFSLGKAYASIQGYPAPPPTKVSVFGKEIGGRAPWWVPFVGGSDLVHTLTNTNVVNVGESNYFDMIGQARDWAQQQKGGGEAGGGFPNDNKSQAIYYFKLSQRYGDKDSAEKFLWDAARFGETDEGVKGTLKALDPLQGLKENERARYMEQLSPDDSERLRRAYQHWAQLVAPSVDVAPLVKLPIKDMVRQLRAQVDGALAQEWSNHIASGQTADPLITKIRAMPADQRQAYLSSQNAAGEQRIRDRYGVLQQRAAPNLNKSTVAAFNKLPLADYVKQMDQAIMQYRQMKMQQDVQEKAHR